MKIPFGLHIIKFDGGLGNQMFEYAFYLSLRRRFPFALYGFDTYASDIAHNGYELDKIFHIDSHKNRSRNAFLRKLERHHFCRFDRVMENNYMTYCANVYHDIISPHEFIGFWQTEKYFLSIESKIRKTFQFRLELLSENTKQLATHIKTTNNSISLHVRRGDYMGINSTKTFGLEYYDAAVKLLRTKFSGGRIFVFSDDVEWAKANLLYENMIFVDWNVGADSWQDMYLMSLCTYNIIANSSFSWWSAWLNNNNHKIVIAPKKWMKEEPVDSDIIPNSWIRL